MIELWVGKLRDFASRFFWVSPHHTDSDILYWLGMTFKGEVPGVRDFWYGRVFDRERLPRVEGSSLIVVRGYGGYLALAVDPVATRYVLYRLGSGVTVISKNVSIVDGRFLLANRFSPVLTRYFIESLNLGRNIVPRGVKGVPRPVVEDARAAVDRILSARPRFDYILVKPYTLKKRDYPIGVEAGIKAVVFGRQVRVVPAYELVPLTRNTYAVPTIKCYGDGCVRSRLYVVYTPRGLLEKAYTGGETEPRALLRRLIGKRRLEGSEVLAFEPFYLVREDRLPVGEEVEAVSSYGVTITGDRLVEARDGIYVENPTINGATHLKGRYLVATPKWVRPEVERRVGVHVRE